jgi:2-polyprenyl-3-methyl-5-hydroxy-6-metoxy-1,4-benzoquinol methylase
MVIKHLTNYIHKHCIDKRVVDIGCAGQTEYEDTPFQLHREYCSVAKEAYGLDINKEEITKGIKNKTTNLYCVDVTSIKDISNFVSEHGQFDVVLCMELIEHIENAGLLMTCIDSLLTATGTLIITTPNMLCPKWAWQRQKEGRVIINKEHVCWYDAVTLSQLLDKHGFKVTAEHYCGPVSKDLTKKTYADFGMQDWMCRRIVIVAEKKNDTN